MTRISLLVPAIAFLGLASCDQPPTSPAESTPEVSARRHEPIHVIDLGTLGGTTSRAVDVNDRGIVVGVSYTASGSEHAFRWSFATGMQDLGTLGGSTSQAIGINRRGFIAGWSTDAEGNFHLVMWTPKGEIRELGDLPSYGDYLYGSVVDINDHNEIFGDYDFSNFRWSEKTGLVVYPWKGEIYAEGANNFGDVVGWWCCGNNVIELYGAFWVERGVAFQDIGGITGYASYAYAVNDHRVVVGRDVYDINVETRPYDTAPFLWTPRGGFQILGSLGGRDGEAINVNNRGEIVGNSSTANGESHGFYWTDTRGMVDIGPGIPLAINNERGWIAGHRDGHAVLWTGIRLSN